MLDSVHIDVCYMKDKIVGSAPCLIIVIDEHLGKSWAFSIAHKNQVLIKNKKLHAKVNRKNRRKAQMYL